MKPEIEVERKIAGLLDGDVSEADIKRECRYKLRAIGAYVVSPVLMGMGRAKAGIDDYVCWQGKFVGIEFKRAGESPTVKQRQALEEIGRAGGRAFIARSWEDVWKGLGCNDDPYMWK